MMAMNTLVMLIYFALIKYGLVPVTLLLFSGERGCVPPRWFILQKLCGGGL